MANGEENKLIEDLGALDLTKDEQVLVDVEGCGGEPEKFKFAVVAKVLSKSPVNLPSLAETLGEVWGTSKTMKWKSLGDGMILFSFSSNRERRRVLQDGPWSFNDRPLLFVEYDGLQRPTELEFKHMIIWTRIYDLPVSFMNNKMAEKLGGLFGDVLETDTDEEGCGWGEFLRFRVKIDISKPVRRGVLLKTPSSPSGEWFAAKYEKLPHLCFSCGLIGHEICACDDEKESGGLKKKYNEELRALRGKRGVFMGRQGGGGDKEKPKTKDNNPKPGCEGERSSSEGGIREDVESNKVVSEEREVRQGGSGADNLIAAGGVNEMSNAVVVRGTGIDVSETTGGTVAVGSKKKFVVRRRASIRKEGGVAGVCELPQEMDVEPVFSQERGVDCNGGYVHERSISEGMGRGCSMKRKRKGVGENMLLAITSGKENEGEEEELTGPKQKRKKRVPLALLSQNLEERSASAANVQPRRTL